MITTRDHIPPTVILLKPGIPDETRTSDFMCRRAVEVRVASMRFYEDKMEILLAISSEFGNSRE